MFIKYVKFGKMRSIKMKLNILEKLNTSALALLKANSTKQLETAIAESTKSLVEAAHAQLYLYTKERLKREYSSSIAIKKSSLIKEPLFKTYLQNDSISLISQTKFHKWKLQNIPSGVQGIIVVPLIYKKDSLGFILLYHTAPELSELEKETLLLFSQTAVLAITKARLQEESKKSLEIRDRFISLASHELRTPLTSLHGYIQLLHAKMADKKTVEARWVKELHIESIRLTTLVKELLDVNRIKQGQFAFVFSEVQMNDVVNRALDHYRLTSADHSVVYQNKTHESTAKVVGDFDKLVEMVSGLLGNAIKFSKPDEKITVTLKVHQGILSLTVKDVGRGISKRDLTAVFDGFYKSTHASYMEGMGVGLLLAKHIVDNHRGKIKITSKENKGTKVEVNLPTIKTSPL